MERGQRDREPKETPADARPEPLDPLDPLAGANPEESIGTIFEWGGSRYAVLSIESAPSLQIERLTSTEASVAKLVADGMTNLEIARERGTSTRTIANQVASILRKLKLRSRVGLAEHLARSRSK